MGDLPKIGDRLGRFRILRPIGSGARSAVFLAEDELLKTPVSLKLIDTADATPDEMAELGRQVLVARQVSHPAICRVFDLHQEGPFLLISMEYVEGRPLSAVLDEQGPFAPARAARIAVDLCQGLEAAHHQGIVHGNLKPQNVILGEHDRVWILDLALASSTQARSSAANRITPEEGSVLAPEVLQGMDVIQQTDVFGIGLLLYYCLAGRLPYSGKTLLSIIEQMEAHRFQPPSAFNVVNAPLDDVVLRALEPLPAQRFPSVRLLAQAVRAAMGSGQEEAATPEALRPWDGNIEALGGEAPSSNTATQRIVFRDVTVLFSDIVGITPYFEKHGDTAGMKKIRIHNELLFPVIERHRGRVVKTIGDAIMACFEKPQDGADAARDMQRLLKNYNGKRLGEDDRIRIRIGLHCGKAIIEGRDVYGDVVNVAARISSQAEGGQILISDDTAQKLRDRGSAVFHSTVTLKGKTEPFELFSVTWEPEEATVPKASPAPSLAREPASAMPTPLSLPSAGRGGESGPDDARRTEEMPVVADEAPPVRPAPAPAPSSATEVFIPAVESPSRVRRRPPGLPASTAEMPPAGSAAAPAPPPESTVIFAPAIESPSRVRRRPPTLPHYLSPMPEPAPGASIRYAARRRRTMVLSVIAVLAAMAAVLAIASLVPPADTPDAAIPPPKPFSPHWREPPDAGPPAEERVVEPGVAADAGPRTPADQKAPALAAGDPDRLAPDPEARQVSMTPLLFELGDTERALSRAMQQKGLIAGDIAELDREMKKIASLRRGRKYAEALQAGRRALSLVERFELDEDFLKKKNARFNLEFDRAGSAAAGDAELARVARDILAAIGEKRFVDANLLLNKAFRLVSRHASRR